MVTGQGGIVTLQYHAERIANQQDLDADAARDFSER